jgi:uncharacterized protein YndB with AHSA1/START domain
MEMVEIEVRETIAAPAGAIWALLADAAGWARWSAFIESSLDRAAPGPDPDGVGAIRRFKSRYTTTGEEVVAFEEARHLAYVVLSGMPIRDYRADVTLTPTAGGGTEITWHSTFRPKLPGTGHLIGSGLRRFMRELVADLRTEVERAPAAL